MVTLASWTTMIHTHVVKSDQSGWGSPMEKSHIRYDLAAFSRCPWDNILISADVS